MSFYDIALAQERARALLDQQKANAVQHTNNVIIQRTKGLGWSSAVITFDTVFTAEPCFTTGATFVSSSVADWLPVASAHVLAWRTDGKGHYVGAEVYFHVDAYFLPGFLGKSRPAGSYDVPPVPVMAHNLSFLGMAYTKRDASVDAQLAEVAQQLREMS